jgi:hypothetical protein
MPASLNAVFYCKNVPNVWFEEDGQTFHVSYDVGEVHAEFVMSPRVFNGAICLADEARAIWQQQGGRNSARPIGNNVTKLPKKRA